MGNKEKEFRKLYEQYFEYVYNYVYRRISNFVDTEDIVAETFTAVWSTWDNFDKTKNEKSWVFTIASHKLNDFLRRKYKIESKFKSLEFEPEDLEPTKTGSKVEKIKPLIQELIQRLAKRDRDFLTLKYKEEYTNRQIAEKLKITINNVKVINNRLIKKLKKEWENFRK